MGRSSGSRRSAWQGEVQTALEAAGLSEWAMSQENVEIVREAYRVLAKGVDERAVTNLVEAGLADPDGEIDFRTAYPDGQVLRLAGVTEFFDTQPWGRSLRFEAESIKAAGTDRVLVFVRVHGPAAVVGSRSRAASPTS